MRSRRDRWYAHRRLIVVYLSFSGVKSDDPVVAFYAIYGKKGLWEEGGKVIFKILTSCRLTPEINNQS
jgi:hypothetical protein